MGEENRTLDVAENEVINDHRRVTFKGMDWARGKDWSALRCPSCSCRHQWRSRPPKRCRLCGIEFIYTANEK